jgi:hypothetical protein
MEAALDERFSVELTEIAEAAYKTYYKAAEPHVRKGDTSHPAVKQLRLIDECLDTIIPHSPLDRDRALAGNLAGIFRVSKGRLRICYIANKARRLVIVLYISETLRKDGDKRDPYQIFTKMVMSGKYDRFFEDLLGVPPPSRVHSNFPVRIQ